MTLCIRAALVALVSFAVASPAAALIMIDDFETGAFTATDNVSTTGSTQSEQSGLPTSSVIGGVRQVSVFAVGTTGASATASLVNLPAVDDSLSMVGSNNGDFNIYYDGIADGIPNLPSGTPGALNANLSGESHIVLSNVVSPGGLATMRLYLYDAVGGQATAPIPVVSGDIIIPLTLFPSINLTDIKTIRLAFLGVSTTSSVTVGQIAAVPEPGTALLLAMGLVGLAGRRR